MLENIDHKNWRKNLGKVITPFLRLEAELNESFSEMRAFHAPSECGDLISNGYNKDLDRLYERAFAEWGVRNRDELIEEVKRRVDGYACFLITMTLA